MVPLIFIFDSQPLIFQNSLMLHLPPGTKRRGKLGRRVLAYCARRRTNGREKRNSDRVQMLHQHNEIASELLCPHPLPPVPPQPRHCTVYIVSHRYKEWRLSINNRLASLEKGRDISAGDIPSHSYSLWYPTRLNDYIKVRLVLDSEIPLKCIRTWLLVNCRFTNLIYSKFY